MKIRFLEDTYIRSVPQAGVDPPIGIVFKGTELEVDSTPVAGEVIESNNWWYCDKKGWYYWSGRTKIIEEPVSAPQEVKEKPIESITPFPDPPPVEDTPPSQPLVPANIDEKTIPAKDIQEDKTPPLPPLEETPLVEEQAPIEHEPVSTPVSTPTPPSGQHEIPRILKFEGSGKFTERTSTPSSEKPISKQAEDPEAIIWQNPPTERLNWAVRNYLIASDWWQKHQLTGKNVRIALLSTGVSPDHPDLNRLEDSFQFPDESQPMQDLHGLGTQAAILAAGAGQMLFGVAPEARLLVGKIGNQDHIITPEGLIAGLTWAIDAQADIIAMLVDFPHLEDRQVEELQQLIKKAVAKGIMLLAPVGTVANKIPESRYPARIAKVLSVGAHDEFGQRCSFSAKSYDLDLLAPGENLLTSSSAGQVAENLRSVAIATAFVAGFLALIRQSSKGKKMTPDKVFTLLRETAASRRPFNKGEDVEYGFGLLNPIEILKKLLDPSYHAANDG